MRITIIWLLAAVLCATTAHAQKAPDNIKVALAKLYPDAKSIKWDKEEDMYEASFKNKGTETSVVFRADGSVAETEHEINPDDLPPKAYTFASAKGKIKEAAKITSDNTVTYEAEVNGADLIFDTNGNFIKSKQEDEENRE